MLKNAQKGSKKVVFLIAANTSKVTFGVLSGTPPESIILRFGVLPRTSQERIEWWKVPDCQFWRPSGAPPKSLSERVEGVVKRQFWAPSDGPKISGWRGKTTSRQPFRGGPQKDPRWVQKSAPEVSKMDPNWASDDFFVFFCIFIKRYVFQHFWALGTQKMTEKRQNGGPKGGFETYEKSTKIN